MSTAVVLLSGGLDSTVTLATARERFNRVLTLGFNYGQRHKRELESAVNIAQFYDVSFSIIDLRSVLPLIQSSSLTNSEIEVPLGHYASETMKATVVPNRNAMFLSVAYGYAVSERAEAVFTGIHAGDHFIYPDCRPEFIESLSHSFQLGNLGFGNPSLQIIAPFVHLTKTDIAREGQRLGVPFQMTWSCYQGQALHCGECGTCVERIEAFDEAGVPDPTEYMNGRL